jgi:hypothetical protein
MMKNTVDHQIPKKIIERKNKKIICRLMKTKWEIMMQTEWWCTKHLHRIYFIKMEECKIMKITTKIDLKKELNLRWWFSKTQMFIILSQWIQKEIMELMIVILLQLQCLQLLIKKFFNNIGILLTLSLIIKDIENWDQHKKVWTLATIYHNHKFQEKCYLQISQKIKCYWRNA